MESSGGVLLTLDNCPNSVATAAIMDVIVTSGANVPPRGHDRASPLGPVEVKKDPSWDRAVQRPCIMAFCVIYPDGNEFVPPGFSVVRHYWPRGRERDSRFLEMGAAAEGNIGKMEAAGGSGGRDGNGEPTDSALPPANVNPSPSGERVYICY